jgi:hypothetical protein
MAAVLAIAFSEIERRIEEDDVSAVLTKRIQDMQGIIADDFPVLVPVDGNSDDRSETVCRFAE